MSEIVPIRPGVQSEPADQQPEQPGKRDFFKKVAAALFGGLTTFGAAKAINSKTGQDILRTSPLNPNSQPPDRPPEKQQLREFNQTIQSSGSGEGPQGYTDHTLKVMDKIKAQNTVDK